MLLSMDMAFAAIRLGRLSLILAMVIATPVFGGPGAPAVSHGPLIGAVSDQDVRIWARVDGMPPESYLLAVEYGEVGDPTGTLSPGFAVDQADDFTGTVHITGLTPDTDYWFRVHVDGGLIADHRWHILDTQVARIGHHGAIRFRILH